MSKLHIKGSPKHITSVHAIVNLQIQSQVIQLVPAVSEKTIKGQPPQQYIIAARQPLHKSSPYTRSPRHNPHLIKTGSLPS